MVALLQYDKYYYDDKKNVKDFLISYADYIGVIDTKIFKILANSEEMSVEELVSYINRLASYDDEIVEIYEVGKKVY